MKELEFSLDFIESLIDLAKKKDVSRLNVSFKNFKVAIDLKQPIFNMAPQNSFQQKSVNVNDEYEDEYFKEEETIKGKAITSPVVGTFYDRPAPDKPPFVKIGDKVKVGDVLFIVEAMKFMNEVTSEFDGVVSNILVESGDTVEFGQTVIVLE